MGLRPLGRVRWHANRLGGRQALCRETDQEFAERLARAVWTANGGPCEVEVRSTYLEDLPHEDFVLDKADYERIMGQTVSAADGG